MPDDTHAPAAGSLSGTRLADVEGLRGGKRRWWFGNEAAFAAPRRIWGIPAAFLPDSHRGRGEARGSRGEVRGRSRGGARGEKSAESLGAWRSALRNKSRRVSVPDTAARPRCWMPRARSLSGAGWGSMWEDEGAGRSLATVRPLHAAMGRGDSGSLTSRIAVLGVAAIEKCHSLVFEDTSSRSAFGSSARGTVPFEIAVTR